MAAPRRCVLLFARSPRAETRAKNLMGAEPLFAEAARRVAEAAQEVGFDLLVVAPEGGRPPGIGGRLAQRGRGFAERLGNAFADARAMGYAQIVAVPGDVPCFSATLLAEAAAALLAGRAVFGPSPDGGVYLIGLPGGEAARALEGVRWRTGAVFADLRARFPASAATVLRPLSDLDRWRDLDQLAREVDTGGSGPDAELRALVFAIRAQAVPRPRPLEAPLPTLRGSGIEPLRGPPLSLA